MLATAAAATAVSVGIRVHSVMGFCGHAVRSAALTQFRSPSLLCYAVRNSCPPAAALVFGAWSVVDQHTIYPAP